MIKTPSVVFFGNPNNNGATYILVIHLAERSKIEVGKKTIRLIDFPEGNYVYIGSATGKRGCFAFHHRLIRHATRKNGKPHAIRSLLQQQLRFFQKTQPLHTSWRSKKLHWHIDFFLENSKASIKRIHVIFSPNRLEERLSLFLNSHGGFVAIEKGLGASDMKQPVTNLLYTDMDLQKVDRIIVNLAKNHVITEAFTQKQRKTEL